MIARHLSRFVPAAVGALCVVAPLSVGVYAHQAVNKMLDTATVTATIEAIDYNARTIKYKTDAGVEDTATLGPEVERFDALKVGDVITMRYYESVAFVIRKPGDPAPPTPGEAALTRAPGVKPGGTLAKQITASVVVEAIDPDVPSITVRTDDGGKKSFKVQDKKNLEGVKVGDRVDVTYTMAIVANVKPAAKPKS